MAVEGYNKAASIALNSGGSSSELTLTIMLVVALIFVPIVLAYQAWVYWTFSHKVTKDELKEEHAY
jgi:cytochrome d ubiquinol oxidase subunit II